MLIVIADQKYVLGTGNNHLEVDTSGYGQADIVIDAGDGNDEVRTRHRMFAIVDHTTLNLVVHLGAGNDRLLLDTAGYRKVRTAIDTGPAGDGRDSVIANHRSLQRSDRKHASALNLDSGLDVYKHTTLGYLVLGGSSGISVEWVFVA